MGDNSYEGAQSNVNGDEVRVYNYSASSLAVTECVSDHSYD